MIDLCLAAHDRDYFLRATTHHRVTVTQPRPNRGVDRGSHDYRYGTTEKINGEFNYLLWLWITERRCGKQRSYRKKCPLSDVFGLQNHTNFHHFLPRTCIEGARRRT